jgi:hypothetical protein
MTCKASQKDGRYFTNISGRDVRSPKDRKDDVSDFDAKEMPQPKR